ncbi:MAG TPA: hypothetical protein VFK89_01195 [Actinomycetota bacterium]|nr:hypothetical protein [Actinomycetota bacterium]
MAPPSPQSSTPVPTLAAPIKPSRAWYWLPVLVVLLIGVPSVLTLVGGIRGIGSGLQRITAPGQETLHLESGTYTVFYEYVSEIDGQPIRTPRDIAGLDITVTPADGGAPLTVSGESGSMNYTLSGRAGYSVAEFGVVTEGDYVVSADLGSSRLASPNFVLALGKDKVKSTIRTVGGAIGSIFSAIAALIAWVVIFFIRLANKRRATRVA